MVTKAAAAKKVSAPQKKSKWATLRQEALKDWKPDPSYFFDAVDPPIEIKPPDTVEQQLALMTLIDTRGSFKYSEIRSLIETICGDSFPAVWQVLRGEPGPVIMPFLNELYDHFMATSAPAEEEVEEIPGKE
ncbi:hypothetical protein [Rhodococcoides fascians]|jgi:hypothetical protein|uniref:hypothetical protein n=1 Tax=Rhodococcoides fascians TaxID=1828 RepID=UPI00050CB036|nr:hypothetical protein [Rhodococcus fascians]